MLHSRKNFNDAHLVPISPHKLSLLILIRFICPTPQKQTPNDIQKTNRVFNDRNIVRNHQTEDADTMWTSGNECDPPFDDPSIIMCLSQFLLKEMTTFNDLTEKDFNDLSDSLLLLPQGNIILDQLNHVLKSFQSPDDITEFFSVLNYIYKFQGHIRPYSPIGTFVGEMLLSFDYMMFGGLSRLFDELVMYKQDSSFKGFLSPIESNNFLEVELKNIDFIIGKVSSSDFDKHIEKIRTIIPDVSKVHLLSLSSNSLNGDFSSSIDKVHQYFDYSIHEAGLPQFVQMNEDDSSKVSNNSFRYLPYAPLTLAMIHIQFGHIEEATKLVLEATRLIQGSNNDHALIVALSLMCQISERQNNHHELFHLLQLCLDRSKEFKDHSVISDTALFLSKFLSMHPTREINLVENGFKQEDKVRPHEVLDSLNIGMKYSINHDRIENIHKAFINSIISRLETWKTFGNKNIVNLLSQIAFQNSKQEYRVPDHILSPLFCSLALQFSSNGHFEESQKILLFAKNHYPESPFKSNWIIAMRQVLHEWATLRHRFDIAEIHINQLTLVTSNTSLSHFFDTLYRHSIMLMNKGALENASNVLTFVIYGCNNSGLHYQTVGYLLTLADIHIKSGSFSTSIPYILGSMTLSDKYKQRMIHNLAKLKLAEVYIQMSDSPQMIKRALNLVGSSTYILEHGTLTMKAMFKLISLKIELLNLLINKSEELIHPSFLNSIKETEKFIVQSEHISIMIEFYYISARIFHFIGDLKERDNASKAFRNLNEKRKIPGNESPEINMNHFYLTYESINTENLV